MTTIEENLNKLNERIVIIDEQLKATNAISLQYRKLTSEQLTKDKIDMDARLNDMNQFRAQLDRQASTFITQKEIDTAKTWVSLSLQQLTEKNELMAKANATKIERLEQDKSKMEGKIWGIGIIWTVLLIFLSWYLNSHFHG